MAFNFKKMSLLIVEDIAPMRTLIASAFETLNVGTIHTAENGEHGYHVFCKSNPDIVVTDWHMKPVDGIEFVKRIRNDLNSPNRLVPVIMITGYCIKKRVHEARDAGVTEFLVKPFTAADIAKRMSHVINRPRDFIDIEGDYFGPDRRRSIAPHYNGRKKRKTDLD